MYIALKVLVDGTEKEAFVDLDSFRHLLSQVINGPIVTIETPKTLPSVEAEPIKEENLFTFDLDAIVPEPEPTPEFVGSLYERFEKASSISFNGESLGDLYTKKQYPRLERLAKGGSGVSDTVMLAASILIEAKNSLSNAAELEWNGTKLAKLYKPKKLMPLLEQDIPDEIREAVLLLESFRK